jgi:GntR family transcriptional regulator
MSQLLEPELALDGSGPIHHQIELQLSRMIRTGVLAPGEELPSVRALAVGLAINPDTVEEALAALEQTGYVTRAEGTGVLVAPRASWDGPRQAELDNLCAEFLRQTACNGYSADEMLLALHARIERGMP